MGAVLTPGDSRQRLETVLVVRPAGMLLHLVKVKDSAKYLAMYRMAPTTKNYRGQNVSNVSVEKPQANVSTMAESRQGLLLCAGKGQECSYP